MTFGDSRFSRFQLPVSHWQNPIAPARDRRVPWNPDSSIACESPISAGTPNARRSCPTLEERPVSLAFGRTKLPRVGL